MASDDLPDEGHHGPSIAPPTLGLRRRKKAPQPSPAGLTPPPDEPEQAAEPEETQPIAVVADAPEATAPQAEPAHPAAGTTPPRRTIFGRTARPAAGVVPTPEPVPGPTPVPSPEPAPSPEPVPTPEPVPSPEPAPSPEPDRDPVGPPEPVGPPDPVAPPAPVEPSPLPGTDPVPEPEPVAQVDQAPAIFADSAGWQTEDDEPRFQDTALLTTRATATPAPAAAPKASAPRPRRMPEASVPTWFVGLGAAVLIGVVVGLVVVAATAGGLQVCTAVQGTTSCGRAGYLLLGAILVAAALVGGVLLRAAKVPDAGSTSVLAVGVMTVLALLFLVGSLFSRWMVVVIPLLGAASYALSHFVTTRVVSSDDD